MNNERRKALKRISDMIADAIGQLGVTEQLEQLRDEEQEAFDNLPESLQESERGETAALALEAMESALDEIQNTLNALEDVTNYLETAAA